MNDKLIFRSDDGVEIKGEEVILPVCRFDDDKYSLIGTAFFIASPGIFVSAKHNFIDYVEPLIPGNKYTPKVDQRLTLIHAKDDKNIWMRHVKWVWYHPHADLLIGQLQNVLTDKNATMDNKVLKITDRPAITGEEFFTFAYPESKFPNPIDSVGDNKTVNEDYTFGPIKDDDKIQNVLLKLRSYTGTITDFNATGITMIQGPCYRTSMVMPAGLSGGPAIGTNGKIFAINSSAVAGRNDSVLSSIQSLLDMQIDDVYHTDMDEHKTMFVDELLKKINNPVS